MRMPDEVVKARDNLPSILSGLTLAAVLWVGESISDLQTAVALQDYRITTLEINYEERDQ